MAEAWRQAVGSGGLILVAVSGGADSTYLAHHLARHAKGFKLEIVHINHGQRGEESNADEESVRALAESLGLPLHVQRLAPGAFLGADGQPKLRPNEADLRAARLGALRALARALGAKAIAMGHQQDDLAESFLLMALRGSGPIGLASMQDARELEPDGPWLIRPLLSISREEIRARLREAGTPWREDSSNESPHFRRNRLRMDVLPLLAGIEPGAIANMAQSACYSGEMAQWYAGVCARQAATCILDEAPGAVLFSTKRLREGVDPALHAGSLRRLWISASTQHEPLPPGRDTLASLVARVRDPAGGTTRFENEHQCKAALTNHFGIIHEGGCGFDEALARIGGGLGIALLDSAVSRPVPSGDRATLALTHGTGGITVLRLSVFDCKPRDLMRKDLQFALIDASGIRGELRLHHPDPADRVLVAPGMHKEFRRCLREAHVPEYAKGLVPAIADDEGVLWIPGIRRAHRALITDDTVNAVRFEWVRVTA